MNTIIVPSERIYDKDFYKENSNRISSVDLNGYKQTIGQNKLFSANTQFYNEIDDQNSTSQGKIDNSIYYDEIAFCKSASTSIYECTLYADKECTNILELKEGKTYKVYAKNADINYENSIYFFVKYTTSLLKYKFIGYAANGEASFQATSTPNPALLIINDYANPNSNIAGAFFYTGKYPTLKDTLENPLREDDDFLFYGWYITDGDYSPYKKYTQNSWIKDGEYVIDNVTSYAELTRGIELPNGNYDPDTSALYAKIIYNVDIDKSFFYNQSNDENISKAIGDVVANFRIKYDTDMSQEIKSVYRTNNFGVGYPQGINYVVEYGESSISYVEESMLGKPNVTGEKKVVKPDFKLEYYVYFSTAENKVLILSHIKETISKSHYYETNVNQQPDITITYTFLINHNVRLDVNAPQLIHKNVSTSNNSLERYDGEEIEFNLIDNSRYKEMAENILKEYENGKETFEIECSVNDYNYGSWDSTNNRIAYQLDEYGKPIKAIDVGGSQTPKMVFEIGDVVIPMKYTNKGDMPMSQYIDGTARAYRITGVSYSYHGVVMQKIRGQEIARENLTNSIMSANIETYRSVR